MPLIVNVPDENFAAFTAFTDTRVTVGPGEKVPFQKVISNVGGSYYPGEGQFVCPYSGTYMFSLR